MISISNNPVRVQSGDGVPITQTDNALDVNIASATPDTAAGDLASMSADLGTIQADIATMQADIALMKADLAAILAILES